ncbi:hypothetical protein FN846DRAFT_904854 [Sphaerosporella brunnea]|uniref:Cell wall mannoprotein PIR1-like C-terminal domain-containing protein n=1 Tax=Sphaerosporella brunnea TaxID=1250544 RepID=A0A5J5F3G4_9PEZI|nr:hypothetical protein FN846DRAFT_904854 [Sphaerosporella brunnea]
MQFLISLLLLLPANANLSPNQNAARSPAPQGFYDTLGPTKDSPAGCGVLQEQLGRIGSIVANRQLQFDGPPAQAGAVFTGGWSVCDDNFLALGASKVFYKCLSGTFYNLYDQSIAAQCLPTHLMILKLRDC